MQTNKEPDTVLICDGLRRPRTAFFEAKAFAAGLSNDLSRGRK